MTEYWVSQAKFWCELCKCWLPDTQQARANHEKGSGHKIAVQRKLREMRKRAEQEKEEEDRTKKELKRIEKGAEKAYAKDQAQMDKDAPPLPPPATPPPQFGSWREVDASPYLFNTELNFYYDTKTGFYYGGDPPEWLKNPRIPEGAKYEQLMKGKGADPNKTIIKGKLPPQIANIGGHQAPVMGSIVRGVLGDKSTDILSIKRERSRERDEKRGLTTQDEEEQRQREEARRRVQARTASAFGLG